MDKVKSNLLLLLFPKVIFEPVIKDEAVEKMKKKNHEKVR